MLKLHSKHPQELSVEKTWSNDAKGNMSGSVEYLILFMPVRICNVIGRFDCINLLQKKPRIRWENKRNISKKTFFCTACIQSQTKAHSSQCFKLFSVGVSQSHKWSTLLCYLCLQSLNFIYPEKAKKIWGTHIY